MVAIKGYFDGKVFVPDEPVDLPANQGVIIHIQPLAKRCIDFRSLLGQGNAASPQNPASRFRSDDELWSS